VADPIPLDQDTIVCHPDDAHKFHEFVHQFKIVECRQLEPGKSYTMRGTSLIVQPPPFDFNTAIEETAPFRWDTMFRPPPSKPFFIQYALPIVPTFVPESFEQENARCYIHFATRAWRGKAKWRLAKLHLRELLDPNYRHPKAKRHA
jgi:hypothetical protein